jgi:hypothetical protein
LKSKKNSEKEIKKIEGENVLKSVKKKWINFFTRWKW